MARTVGDIKWLCTAALLMACGSGTGTGPEPGPDQALRRAALENIGRNVNRYRPLWHPNSGATGAKPRFVLSGDALAGVAAAVVSGAH